MKNYFTKQGKFQIEADYLTDLMPKVGLTENRYMNLFITVSNIYHDVYNNGGINLDSYINYINKYILPFNSEFKSINFKDEDSIIYKNLKNKENLEIFLDEVILFLKDKYLICSKNKIFKASISHLKQYNNCECAVLRKLTEAECDAEVGNMYKVRFENGDVIDVFEDELFEKHFEENIVDNSYPKKKFKIPVSWQLCGNIEVYATDINSALDEAIKKESEGFGFKLPRDSQYVDASFEINEDLDLIKWLNKIN